MEHLLQLLLLMIPLMPESPNALRGLLLLKKSEVVLSLLVELEPYLDDKRALACYG